MKNKNFHNILWKVQDQSSRWKHVAVTTFLSILNSESNTESRPGVELNPLHYQPTCWGVLYSTESLRGSRGGVLYSTESSRVVEGHESNRRLALASLALKPASISLKPASISLISLNPASLP